MTTAFALAGLGGFNAHGAGFLAAADKWNIVPELVTATSGQILVLADWLEGKDLKAGLIDKERQGNPLALLQTALLGYPNVFRPAYMEAFGRLFSWPTLTESFVDIFADRLLPAQEYVPTRTDAFFEETAKILNRGELRTKDGKVRGEVGVVFNAYDPVEGTGVLYGNKLAQKLLPEESSLPPTRPKALEGLRHDTRYSRRDGKESPIRDITPEALKSALWLSLYGFRNLPQGQVDGAYFRSCIVSELHEFDRIFVARPLANGWLRRDLPTNWFEVQDWQCEMWFSVGYKAEVSALKRINDLIAHRSLEGFKVVELFEIEPDTPAGYFNFFIERDAVYEDAFDQASQLFERLQEPDPVPEVTDPEKIPS